MNRNSTANENPWKQAALVVAIILIVAFGLRIWGIWFGLPYIFHNDEGNEVLRALQLGTGQFNFERIDKGLYFYLLFVEYGVLFVVLKLFGVVTTAGEFGEYFIHDPSAFYLIGRATTAAIGTATVYLLYKLGRAAYTNGAALIAAAALAVNILHADLSHYVTVDVPLVFFTTAALLFAIRMIDSGSRQDYWYAALMAACATAAKTPGVLLLIPLITAHYFTVRDHRPGGWNFFRSTALWQAAAVFVLAYVIANPGIVFHIDGAFTRYLGKFIGDDAGSRYIADDVLDSRALFANINLYLYYIKVTIDSMTTPVSVLCAAGMGYALWRRRPADIVLLVSVIPTYLVLGSSNDPFQFFPRYILPAIPVLLLFGARFITKMIEMLPGKKPKLAAGIVMVLLAVFPVSKIVLANYVMTQPDTRTTAAAWVDENVKAGSRIFIEGTRTEPIQGTVPLQNSPENLLRSVENYKNTAPGKARYFRMAIKVQSGKTYDLVTVRPVDLLDIAHYKSDGVQYFVLRPDAYEGSRVRFHWPKLLEDLRADPDVSLVKRFDTDDGLRPGPVVEIYRVNSNVDAG